MNLKKEITQRNMLKTILILSALTTVGFAQSLNSDIQKKEIIENERLCNIYKGKIESYIKKMKEDGKINSYTKATFETYKKKAHTYCNI